MAQNCTRCGGALQEGDSRCAGCGEEVVPQPGQPLFTAQGQAGAPAAPAWPQTPPQDAAPSYPPPQPGTGYYAGAQNPQMPYGAPGYPAWQQPMVPPPIVYPSMADTTRNNGFGVAGFVLAMASIVLWLFPIIPLAGAIFSGIGLATHRAEKHRNMWMAITGLVVSVLFSVLAIILYVAVINDM